MVRFLRVPVSAFLLVLITVTSARAQSTPAPAQDTIPTIRETVVVTATGRDMPESKVGASITVLDSQQIQQRHALSTIDLLRTIPGVIAVRSGGVGNLTSVFVRGGESTYNKVLLDGMPLNEPGGSFNFASLSPENIERVEVLRGAHSALFGSDAMASVIQLFSVRSEPGRPRLNLVVDGGNYSTAHVAAGAGGRTDVIEYSVFGSMLRTDNREPNNNDKNSTLSGMATRTLTSGGSLRFLGRGEGGRTGTPGTTAFGRPDMDAHFRHKDASFQGGWNQALGSHVTQQTSYTYGMTQNRSTNLIADATYTPRFGNLAGAFPSSDFLYDSETEYGRHRVQYRADASVTANQTLTAAFEYDGERAVLTNHRSTAAPQRPSRDNTGTTVQYEANRDRLSLVGGIRFENNGSFGFYVAPRLAASWLVNPGPADGSGPGSTRLRGSLGRGIKEPLFIQSYSPSPSFLGNPDLRPERSRGFDVGIEQRFARNRVALEAIYFSNYFDDLISLGPSDPATFEAQYENIGETRASGLELVGTGFAGSGWRFSGGYTFLDGKVVHSISSSPIFAPGNQLYRRPRHSGSLQASYVRNRVSLAVGGVFIGERVDTDFNFPTIDSNEGYALWNASGEVHLTRGTGVFVTMDNVGNADYMEPLGYPALGRTVRAGVRTRF